MLKWLLFIFFAFLIQNRLRIFGFPLTISTALVYYYGVKGIHRKYRTDGYVGSTAELKSTAFGAFVGMLEDILSGSIIGPALFSKGLIGFFSIITFTDVLFKWTPLAGGLVIAVFTCIDGTVFAALRMLFSDITPNISVIFQTIIIQAVLNIPFGIIFKPADYD
ncbi:MAG: hypothetical protein QMD01_06730 [Thermodesulfovibrionales bacterium]|nr:hypothetical protein [Thermodesulfovibrionales bacterium]